MTRPRPYSLAPELIYEPPVGTVLFHGTDSETPFRYPLGPAWVSDNFHTSRFFAGWRSPRGLRSRPRRVIQYRVKKSPRLLLVRSDDDEVFRNVAMAIAEASGTRGLLQEDEYFDPYDNARSVCGDVTAARLSGREIRPISDGWYAPDALPDGGARGADIVLCEPEKWLSLVSVQWLDDPPPGWSRSLRSRRLIPG